METMFVVWIKAGAIIAANNFVKLVPPSTEAHVMALGTPGPRDKKGPCTAVGNIANGGVLIDAHLLKNNWLELNFSEDLP